MFWISELIDKKINLQFSLFHTFSTCFAFNAFRLIYVAEEGFDAKFFNNPIALQPRAPEKAKAKNVILFLVKNSFTAWEEKRQYVIFILFRISQSASQWDSLSSLKHYSVHLSDAERRGKRGKRIISLNCWKEERKKKKAKTFNILILKWSRKITTGHNRMKSDIYSWWFGIVSWVFNFSYHSWEERGKILRQNCQHLVTCWLRFLCLSFISCHISLSFLTRFLWDKHRNCLKWHWVQKIGRVSVLLIVAVSC